jgi:hypothetical protein
VVLPELSSPMMIIFSYFLLFNLENSLVKNPPMLRNLFNIIKKYNFKAMCDLNIFANQSKSPPIPASSSYSFGAGTGAFFYFLSYFLGSTALFYLAAVTGAEGAPTDPMN